VQRVCNTFAKEGTKVRNLIRESQENSVMMLINIIQYRKVWKMIQNTIKRRDITKHHATSCDIMRYHVTTPRPYRDAQFTPAHGVKIKRTVGKQFMLYKKRNVKSPEYFQTCF